MINKHFLGKKYYPKIGIFWINRPIISVFWTPPNRIAPKPMPWNAIAISWLPIGYRYCNTVLWSRPLVRRRLQYSSDDTDSMLVTSAEGTGMLSCMSLLCGYGLVWLCVAVWARCSHGAVTWCSRVVCRVMCLSYPHKHTCTNRWYRFALEALRGFPLQDTLPVETD